VQQLQMIMSLRENTGMHVKKIAWSAQCFLYKGKLFSVSVKHITDRAIFWGWMSTVHSVIH